MTISVSEQMDRFVQALNQRLHKLVTFPSSLQDNLYQAAFYSLEGTAKRLRPLLLFATVKDFQGKEEEALDPACVIEMIHTYSLIHDDLPCMDDDDLRRGKPSLHKQYTEALAVLTGDFFLTYSFEILSSLPHLSEKKKIQLIQTLSIRAGGQGMIGGQVVDIESEKKIIDEKTLQFMYEHKTAALLQCAVEFGAILSSLDTDLTKQLSQFAKILGYAYQITDDILDATQSTKTLGKPAKSDEKRQLTTILTLLGLEKAQKLQKNLYHKALSYLPQKALFLRFLTKKILYRSY